jgi:hypothetical protein
MLKGLRNKLRETWYRIRYGVIIDYFVGSLPGISGSGRYVSIRKNGPYLDISKDEGTIRIIPFLPTHGIVLEYINSANRTFCRKTIDYDQLKILVCDTDKPTEDHAHKIYNRQTNV